MQRHAQFLRVFGVLRLLARPGGSTLEELSQEMGVSVRTVRRDLEALDACGIPVVEASDDIPKRWAVLSDWLARSAWQPTFDEVVAISLVQADACDLLGGAFGASLRALIGRARATVPRALLQQADELASRAGSLPRPRTLPLDDPGLVADLMRAAHGGEELFLDYDSASHRGRGRRRVEPLLVATRPQGAYLLARDVLQGEQRTYALPRIRSVARTGRRFEPEGGDGARAHLAHGFGVHGGTPQRVVVRFEAGAARYVRERTVHASQRLRDLPGGRVELEMRVGGLVEVKSWVQSFGAMAEVVEPRSLAQEIAADAERVLARAAPGGRAPAERRPVTRRRA